MLLKKHTGFTYRLIGMLFLFFNCVCTAAPVIKTSLETHKTSKVQLAGNSNAIETEEEGRLANASFENQYNLSFRNTQHCNRLFKKDGNGNVIESNSNRLSKSPFAPHTFLLRPAYYLFLFRYNLF